MKNNNDDRYDQWYERWEHDDLTFDEIKEGYRKYYGEAYADMLTDECGEDEVDFSREELAALEKVRRSYRSPHREPTEFSLSLDREYRRQQWRRFWRNLGHDTINLLIWGVFMATAVAIAIWIKGG